MIVQSDCVEPRSRAPLAERSDAQPLTANTVVICRKSVIRRFSPVYLRKNWLLFVWYPTRLFLKSLSKDLPYTVSCELPTFERLCTIRSIASVRLLRDFVQRSYRPRPTGLRLRWVAGLRPVRSFASLANAVSYRPRPTGLQLHWAASRPTFWRLSKIGSQPAVHSLFLPDKVISWRVMFLRGFIARLTTAIAEQKGVLGFPHRRKIYLLS